MIDVLIVDDFPAVRSGLRHLIGTSDDLTVAGEAADGEEAVARAAELEPDVVLMDMSLPGIDGCEATRRIIAANPDAAVLMLTACSDGVRAREAIASGAVGYLVKDVAPPDLLEGIRRVARGQSPLDPSVARSLLAGITAPPSAAALSPRETEILKLVAKGLGNKQIARRLVISEKTVKNHLTRIFSTIGAGGRTEAALWAVRVGLVEEPA